MELLYLSTALQGANKEGRIQERSALEIMGRLAH